MKKEMKKITTKNYDKPSNIFYMITETVLAAFVPVMLWAVNIVYFVTYSSLLEKIDKAKKTGAGGYTHDWLSIKKLFEYLSLIKGNKESGLIDKINVFMNGVAPVRYAVIFCGVFIFIALIAVIGIIITAFATKRKVPMMIISGIGIISMISFAVSFQKISAAVVSETIGIASFVNIELISPLLKGLVDVVIFRLSSAYWLILFDFFAIFALAGTFFLIDGGDDKFKKNKKMKKEKKV